MKNFGIEIFVQDFFSLMCVHNILADVNVTHALTPPLDCSDSLYLLHSAWVVQLQFGNDTAGLQRRPSSLHVMDTARLPSSQSHNHLHHLESEKGREWFRAAGLKVSVTAGQGCRKIIVLNVYYKAMFRYSLN